MRQYHDLLKLVLEKGTRKSDRTGTGTISYFGPQMRFDLAAGFPLVTTKKVFWRGVAEELFWMIRGETNVKSLQEKNVHIWDEWADENGELGPVYGKQWTAWETNEEHGLPVGNSRFVEINQLKNVVERIKTKPDDRRLIVSAWNVADIDSMKLPPCHCFFQFYVANGKLSCHMYQRSADLFLGVPFNIASYALLTHLVAHATELEVGEFVHSFGDAHIYLNHLEQVQEQLKREPRALPALFLRKDTPRDLFEINYSHLALEGYNPHPPISGEVSV